MRNSLMSWNANETSPFRTFRDLEKQMDNLFGNFWVEGTPSHRVGAAFTPACDIEETDSHYLLSFDLPGLNKEDIKIEVENNVLNVSGERKRESKKETSSGRTFERYFGTFCRSFTLPTGIEADKIEAEFQNGVLQLGIPKAEKAKTKQIKIGDAAGGLFSRLISGNDKEKH